MQKYINIRVISLIAVAATGLVFAATAIAGKDSIGPSLPALSDDEVAGILFMREEEKLARDSYLVLFERWGIPVFDNIAQSERRHMDAMKNLVVNYGLEDPVKDESVIGGYQNHELQELFDSLMEKGELSATDGLEVGALIEETDILDIHHEMELADHEDIIATYESLVCGSRNHLRAFVGQLELNGVIYQPGFLEPEDFLAIVETPVERDCGTGATPKKGAQ